MHWAYRYRCPTVLGMPTERWLHCFACKCPSVSEHGLQEYGQGQRAGGVEKHVILSIPSVFALQHRKAAEAQDILQEQITAAMRQRLLLCLCLITSTSLLKEALAVRETKYYDALGVPPDADENVINESISKGSAVSAAQSS